MTLSEHGKREGSPLHHPMVWLAVFWDWAILLKHSETTREKLHTGPIQRGLGQSPSPRDGESREPSRGRSARGWAYTPVTWGGVGTSDGAPVAADACTAPGSAASGGGAAPGSGAGRGDRPGRAAAPGPRAAPLPGRLAPRGRRRGGGEGGPAACWGSSAPASRAALGPAPGSRVPSRDSPERPGSASWCPSGCPCLCSDSTWCSSPPQRRLRVAPRGAGVTFKAGGQAMGLAGGGGAAPGLGWGAGRPPGRRGAGGGGSDSAAGARLGGCAGAATPRGPPHTRPGSLYRAPPRWRRRRRRTNISLRRPNVLLLLLLLRLSETRSGPGVEGGGGREESGERRDGGGVGGREREAAAAAGRAQISREEGSALPRARRGEAREREGVTGVRERTRELGKWGSPAGRGGGEMGGAEGGRSALPF